MRRPESAWRTRARPCASLGELAGRCDIILLCLPTSAEVHAVIFGQNGLAGSAKPGTLIIDQTTGDHTATRAMSAELAGRGVELIDAPVSGGPRGADVGTIAIMVGATADQYARAEPILRSISPNVFHAGGVGTAHVIKLVNNMLFGAQRLVSFEGLALAVKNGIEPRMALDIILARSGRNFYLEHFGAQIISGNLKAGFTLGLLHKDVRLATQLGADSGVPLFLGNIARDFYRCASTRWVARRKSIPPRPGDGPTRRDARRAAGLHSLTPSLRRADEVDTTRRTRARRKGSVGAKWTKLA